MHSVDIKDKIKTLGMELPSFESFLHIGDLTALRQDRTGKFYRSNYERGLLLYSLIATQRPKIIVEFGTGRGFGALCMARALVDHGIDGGIYTIDLRQYDEKQPWIINDGDEPRLDQLAWSDVWPKHFPASWLERIHCLNGLSGDVMRRWRETKLPAIDFGFIDGGHSYSVVKHDFYSILQTASPNFQVLFDDYAEKPGFGVCEFINDEVTPAFHTELIWTDRRWYGAEREHNTSVDYGMVLLTSSKATFPLQQSFPHQRVNTYLFLSRTKIRLKKPLARIRNFISSFSR